MRTLILDSLRYWVTEMHVDGFRFDLASVLARTPTARFNVRRFAALRRHPHRSDPATVHLIAEPWDAGWAYQLGTSFPAQAGASGTAGSGTTSAGSFAAIPAWSAR